MNEEKRKDFVLSTCRSIAELCKNKKGETSLSDVVVIIMLIIGVFFDHFSDGNKTHKSLLYKKLIIAINKTFLNEEENEA